VRCSYSALDASGRVRHGSRRWKPERFPWTEYAFPFSRPPSAGPFDCVRRVQTWLRCDDGKTMYSTRGQGCGGCPVAGAACFCSLMLKNNHKGQGTCRSDSRAWPCSDKSGDRAGRVWKSVMRLRRGKRTLKNHGSMQVERGLGKMGT